MEAVIPTATVNQNLKNRPYVACDWMRGCALPFFPTVSSYLKYFLAIFDFVTGDGWWKDSRPQLYDAELEGSQRRKYCVNKHFVILPAH